MVYGRRNAIDVPRTWIITDAVVILLVGRAPAPWGFGSSSMAVLFSNNVPDVSAIASVPPVAKYRRRIIRSRRASKLTPTH